SSLRAAPSRDLRIRAVCISPRAAPIEHRSHFLQFEMGTFWSTTQGRIGFGSASNHALTISPRREFLYVDDLADAGIHLLRHYSGESHINIGAGYDVTIAEFAEHIKRCVGFEGRIVYDRSRPDGTPRKLLDSGRIQALGWSATTPLEEG